MNPRSDSPVIIEDEPAKSPATAATPIIVQEAGDAAVVNEDADAGFELPQRAKRNDDGTITLALYKTIPVIIRNSRNGERTESYDSLTFGRLNGEAITAITNTAEASRPIVMLAKSAMISEQLMAALWKKMDGTDITAAVEIVASFFESGPKTRRPK